MIRFLFGGLATGETLHMSQHEKSLCALLYTANTRARARTHTHKEREREYKNTYGYYNKGDLYIQDNMQYIFLFCRLSSYYTWIGKHCC